MRENKLNIYFVFKTAFLVIGIISVFGKKYLLQYFSKTVISTFSMIILGSIFIIGGIEDYKRGNIENSKRYFMIAAAIMTLSVLTFIF